MKYLLLILVSLAILSAHADQREDYIKKLPYSDILKTVNHLQQNLDTANLDLHQTEVALVSSQDALGRANKEVGEVIGERDAAQSQVAQDKIDLQAKDKVIAKKDHKLAVFGYALAILVGYGIWSLIGSFSGVLALTPQLQGIRLVAAILGAGIAFAWARFM